VAQSFSATVELENAMSSASNGSASISVRLQNVANELREIQDHLSAGEDVAPPILTDFRDAVNRVRNTAWAVEQYANTKTMETDAKSVLSLVAAERVRVAYQLWRLIEADLANPEIQFQPGQLVQFRQATADLGQQLTALIGK
jgi:hypothetical protein